MNPFSLARLTVVDEEKPFVKTTILFIHPGVSRNPFHCLPLFLKDTSTSDRPDSMLDRCGKDTLNS
jgi:hypothetical protein